MSTIRRWVTVLIVVEAIMLVAAITGGVIGLWQLSDARGRVVDEVDPELIEAQNLTAALLNQETGVRGYLLSGRAEFRTPYDEGRAQQDKAATAMRQLGAVDGTPAGDQLTAVLAKAKAWQDTAQVMLSSTVPADQAIVDTGKTQFDTLRTELENQRVKLTAIREVDRGTLRDAATLLTVVFTGIALLLVILFVVLALGFHRKVARPLLELAGEIKTATDDIDHGIRHGDGPRELVELAEDVEALRRRIVNEVSELRQAHAMLDERTRELQRSNSDLEQFAYVASHDLQEPLRKVTSFCQLLQRRYQGRLDERGEQYIAFAVDGARRMQVLINDLLAFSRVGRGPAELEPVEMGEAVRAAVENLDTVITPSGAEVTYDDDLPTVQGEKSLLTAVFQNMLSNAIKFRGDEPPRIHIGVEPGDGEWIFSLSDNGIGIEAEYAERIFVIFQRLHPRSAYPGTGIGLALTRKIVEYHGGRIWLDTEHSDGTTTFRFTLPRPEKP